MANLIAILSLGLIYLDAKKILHWSSIPFSMPSCIPNKLELKNPKNIKKHSVIFFIIRCISLKFLELYYHS